MPLDTLVAPLAAFLAPAAPPLAPTPQFHGAVEVRTSVLFGVSRLDDDFEPAEEHTLLGLVFDAREPGRTIGFEFGYLQTFGDGTASIGANTAKADACVHELFFGARWTFDPFDGPVRPYLGTGVSVLRGEFEAEALGLSNGESGWAWGLYGHGGLEWNFTTGWAVGVDLRTLLTTKASLQEQVPLDAWQAALTLTWSW
jgi:hypothetical protein